MKTVHVICGPTAGGKSARALELAAQLNGAIINADSMQLYDALPTLTAQPSQEDFKKAPHLLYGALHPNDPSSAGNWRELAVPAIEKVLASGKTPIITGGSGLYIKALIEGLSPIPDIPAEIRARVSAHHDKIDTPAFYEELRQRDPDMAARLDRNNKARLIRAMEVIEATGRSLADWQKQDRLAPPADWNFEIELIMPERDELYDRCNRRFEAMLESGALDEVKALDEKIDKGEVAEGVPITKALGFIPLRAWLKGQITKDEAIERSQAETRQYAKRQVTWFRHQI